MRSNERPRVLLVSVGSYGRKYLEEITGKDLGCETAGIVDTAPGLEDRYPVIRERKIPLYTSLEAFYAENRADLAVIASPIHLHTPMTMTCLAQGTHVLCEKPLCLTEEETLRMAEAAEGAGRFLALGWQLNYDRGVLALKKDILSGRFGAPRRFKCLHAMRRGEKYYARAGWAGRITAEGREVLDSPFMNACAHNFQMMTFLLGDRMDLPAIPEGAEGELYRGNPGVENYDIALLRFTLPGEIRMCYYTAHPLETKNLGQTGVGEFEHGTLTWGRGQPYRFLTDTGEEILYGPDGGTPLMQKLYDALTCVREGGAPLCGPKAGLGHLRAVRLAQELPIRDIDPARVEWKELEEDRVPCVKELEKVMQTCFDRWALPGEAGLRL